MEGNASSKKTKPISGYIRRVSNGDYQLFTATGLVPSD